MENHLPETLSGKVSLWIFSLDILYELQFTGGANWSSRGGELEFTPHTGSTENEPVTTNYPIANR